MDVEAPAAPRWRKRMQPITHAPAEGGFQPLLLGSPRRRKRSPAPSAAAFGRSGIAATRPAIAARFSHRKRERIVAFMLVFLGWCEFLVVPRLERCGASVNKSGATTRPSACSPSLGVQVQQHVPPGLARPRRARAAGRIWKASDPNEAQELMTRNAAWGLKPGQQGDPDGRGASASGIEGEDGYGAASGGADY